MSTDTNIRLKKSILHKVGDQPATPSDDLPTPVVTNSFLHKTVHAAGHDLRSPLFVIRAYSQLLQKTQEKNVLDQGLQLMDQATGRMEKTINEFVHLIDLYTLPFPEKTTVSFESALETAQFQLVNLIHQYQPTFSFDFADFPTTHFHEKYLIDILTYLLDNAIRHNTDQENLTVKVYSKMINNKVTLVVEDNGKGIEDDPNKVSSPFYTYTKEEQPECVGMGLAKVKAIAQVSQCSFSLESEAGVTRACFVFG